jgi:hypothetical protein
MAYPDGSMPVFHDSDPARLIQWADFYKFAHEYFGDAVFARYADPERGGAPAVQPSSAAMKGIGIVALRRGVGSASVCAMIDYGIHGGHHGHPDKLNIVLYALGRELVLDPGRITYSVPEYQTWARTTVAHNTVVINRKNQEPTEGQLLYFENAQDYAACLCVSKDAYPGFALRRFLVLTDGWLADVYAVTGSGEATFDWLLHCLGTPQAPVQDDGTSAAPVQMPQGVPGAGPGYEHLSELRLWRCKSPFVLRFAQPGGKVLGVHCWDDGTSGLLMGAGIGYQLADRVPFAMRRRRDTSACYVTVYDLSGTGARVRSIEVGGEKIAGAEAPLTDLVRIRINTTAGGSDLRLDLRDEPEAGAPRLQIRPVQ